MKITIICGPDLDPLVANKLFREFGGNANSYFEKFPEASFGAKFVRNMFCEIVKLCRDETSTTNGVFIATRYSTLLNLAGNMVSDGVLARDEVSIILVDDGDVSHHAFDSLGVIEDGWPFGILD